MPKVFTVEDTGDALTKLFRKAGDVERMVTRPDVMAALPSGPGFGPTDVIAIGGFDIGGVLVDLTQAPVTGVITLTTGAYMGDVFIDVSWTAVAGTPLYEVEMTKVLSPGVYSGVWTQQTGANNIRFRGLEPNATYGFRVYGINHLGIHSTSLPSSGYTQITTGEDSTVPPAVSSVVLARGASTAIVKFTGLTEAQAADVANGNGTYQIQISTDPTFAAVSQEQYTTATIVSFPGIDAATTYYARVRAIDTSGNASAWASPASGATVGGVIDAMIVSGLDAAKITFGTMSGDRITANTIDVASLKTSTLLAKIITLGAGGQIFVNNPPTDGLVINSSGIRAYQSGATTLWIDSSGNCQFTGSINSGSTVTGATITGTTVNGGTINGTTITGGVVRTNSSGQRVEISSVVGAAVSFYSSNAAATSPASINVAGGIGGLGLFLSGISTAVQPNAPAVVLNGGNTAGFDGGFVSIQARQVNIQNYGSSTSIGLQIISGGLYLQDGTVSIGGGGTGTTRLDMIGNGDLNMRGGYVKGSYDGQAPALIGYEGHRHTFGWGGYGGGSIYSMYIDTLPAFEVGYDGSSMDFYFLGAYIKSFVIPHPVDIDKLLVHACVEGPEARVEYVGVGELDSDGEAWIDLPDYVEALTHTARRHVEVTVYDNGYGDEIPKAIPTYPVNGKFHVRSSLRQPALFSWSLSAVRKDVDQFDVEPVRSEVTVRGDGPYTYIDNRKAA